MGFFYDWHNDWHEHSKRKRHRQKLNDWHNDWHEHSKRKRHEKAHLIFQLFKTQNMQLIAGKVRVSLTNEVIAKQKRLIHETAFFDVQLPKFIELIEMVQFGTIITIISPSGIDISFGYTYQGNQFTYYLNPDQNAKFKEIAKQKNFKLVKHEI